MSKEKLQFGDIKLGLSTGQSNLGKGVISKKDIAIIGIAGRFPMADSTDEFWQILRSSVDCIRPFPESRRRDIDKYIKYTGLIKGKVKYSDFGFLDEIDKFDHDFFGIPLNEARVIDPNQRIFLETAWQAVEDAGYGNAKIIGTRTGVYVGYKSALSNIYQKYIMDTRPNLLSLAMFGNKPHILCGRVSYFLNLKGPSMLIDTACSGSLIALNLACQSIRNGECEMALAGSIKLMSVPIDGIDEKLGIESPDFRTRSFDDKSLGTGPGEGCAVILIKPLYKAIDDRDHIYAVIKGTASNQDGRSIAMAVPDAEAQADVISRAWQDAGINPETISLIETHGSGTVVGDPIEVDGLTRAFRKYSTKKQFCAIGAVKSNIGHLDNAATIAGLVKCILALKNKELPPSNHVERPNRNINFIQSPVYVNQKLKTWKRAEHPRRCGITGIGLNGTNCHVLLEEAPDPERKDEPFHGYDIFTLSAKTESALKNFIRIYKKFLIANPEINVHDLCFTTNTGKGHYSHRLAFVYKDKDDFKAKLLKLNNLVLAMNNDQESVFYGFQGSAETEPGNSSRQSSRVNEIIREHLAACSGQTLLEELCCLYAGGEDVNWDLFHSHRKHYRISTPSYPFDKIRCWVEVPENRMLSPDVHSIPDLLASGRLPEDLARELEDIRERCKPFLDVLAETKQTSSASIVLCGKEENYTQLEKGIAAIWCDYMGLEEIDINKNFFSLGGDSIMALKITMAINSQLNLELRVVDFLKNPSISELGSFVEKKREPQSASV